MSKKTDGMRRLRLFDQGNTQCPICLTNFSRPQVASGKKVTLEHAPPASPGGKVVCLTCKSCNNGASRLDYAARLAEKSKIDHETGRGTKVEVDFFGGGITSGYLRPKSDEVAAKFAKQPIPASIRQFVGGEMKLPHVPLGPNFDPKKGMRFRVKRPNSHHVAVSWLRSAFLLVFSLLGSHGYRFARSPAIRPIREQITHPDEMRIRRGLSARLTGLDFPIDPVIMMNTDPEPRCWVVTMNGHCVALPCGGPIDRYQELRREAVDTPVNAGYSGFWVSTRFGNSSVISFAVNTEANVDDADFIGGKLEIAGDNGDVWEWMIVDCQSHELIALPLRAVGAEPDGSIGVTMMITHDQYMGRSDREKFGAMTPKTLPSIQVERSRSGTRR